MIGIREKVVPMADPPNPEKAKLWQQFQLLEDDQTSIKKLMDKLNSHIMEGEVSNQSC